MIYNSSGEEILSKKDLIMSTGITVEYGRANGSSFYFLRIPKKSIDGKMITPKVGLTSADNTVDGVMRSVLDWAKTKTDVLVAVNAGFLRNGTGLPVGALVIDGVGYQTETITNNEGVRFYPLCIDNNGDLSCPYPDRTVTNATIISGGYKYAVTAWGTPVVNYSIASSSVFDEVEHKNTPIPQQLIGQMQNGDYFIFTIDGDRGDIVNEAGMTYAQAASILVDKGAKFAYSLDGGGSTETVIGERQINPIYENATGRIVGTVIYFSVDD